MILLEAMWIKLENVSKFQKKKRKSLSDVISVYLLGVCWIGWKKVLLMI